MVKRILFFFFLLTRLNVFAQIDSLSMDTLHDAQIRLADWGERMIRTRDEDTRLLCSRNFLITLSRSLRVKNSYYFGFDSLKSVSILYSPDNKFRIFSWNVALNNEVYHHFGVIQMHPEYLKKVKDTTGLKTHYPLIDRSHIIKNAIDTTVGAEFWFGAVYYQLVPMTYKKKTYYFLMGWNGSTQLTNKKVVDVLYFENNKPYFGAAVFRMNESRFPKPLKRLVFEFSNRGTMALRYSEKKKYLIIENIVPPKPQDYGHPETYLPDGSYEYMVWEKGFWNKKGPLKDFDLE